MDLHTPIFNSKTQFRPNSQQNDLGELASLWPWPSFETFFALLWLGSVQAGRSNSGLNRTEASRAMPHRKPSLERIQIEEGIEIETYLARSIASSWELDLRLSNNFEAESGLPLWRQIRFSFRLDWLEVCQFC